MSGSISLAGVAAAPSPFASFAGEGLSPFPWYVVFDASGNVVSIGTGIDRDHVTSQGFTWMRIPFDPRGMVWNKEAQQFQSLPPQQTSLTAYAFKMRFTPQERMTLRIASESDPVVGDFLDMLATAAASGVAVFPQTPPVLEPLQYCVSKGYLTAARASVIGGP